MAIYACGHKTPDLDSIASAISLSFLKGKLNQNVIPARLGELNPESIFVLDKFELDVPILKTSFAHDELYITDYSDRVLGPEDLDQTKIVGIIDHHKLGDITTSTPLECWIRPVGCTNTIIFDMFRYYNIEIPKNIAGLMMCAILVDTVVFKSPTCTNEDIKAVKELSQICGIEDFVTLGIELFRVKSTIEGTPIAELVLRDYKEFDMHGNSVGIGQLEVVDGTIFDSIKDELQRYLEVLRVEKNLHMVTLLLTDIMKEGSEVLVSSKDSSIFEKAFNVKLDNNRVWMDGCLSRKKQIIPFLEPAFL